MFHLFRKDIEKHCAYCKSGSVINEGQVICSAAAYGRPLADHLAGPTFRRIVRPSS